MIGPSGNLSYTMTNYEKYVVLFKTKNGSYKLETSMTKLIYGSTLTTEQILM